MLNKSNYSVTIVVTTYNLEKYIEKALDSILAQKTEFNFKILIGDDCSSDKTPEILKSYKLKFPEKIDLVLNPCNMGSVYNSSSLFNKIDTDYISFLDGDDYWINENRLQKQFDFLESNPEYIMCGANTLMINEDNDQRILIDKNITNSEFGFDEYINGRGYFVHTSSILLRNLIYKKGIDQKYFDAVGKFYECAFRGEDVRFLDHLKMGKIKVFVDEVFSVYRIHSSGIWQGSSELKRNIESIISYYIFQNRYLDNSSYFFYNLCFNQYKIFLENLNLLLSKNFNLIQVKEYNLFLEFYNYLILNDRIFCNFLRNKFNNLLINQNRSQNKIKIKYLILMKIYNKIKKILIKKNLLNENNNL